jgi:hypothetical protein
MKKHLVISALFILGIVGLAFATGRLSRNGIKPPHSATDTVRGPDVSDDSVLVGLSHVVFVGKIIRQLGDVTYPGTKTLITQFEVRVVYNVKGNVQGSTILGQVRGVEPLAQVGSTYFIRCQVQ